MRPASELLLIEPGLGEQRANRVDVHLLPAMRSASNGEFHLPEAKGGGGATFDQRNGLQRFDR
jgi:hypothetical protein